MSKKIPGRGAAAHCYVQHTQWFHSGFRDTQISGYQPYRLYDGTGTIFFAYLKGKLFACRRRETGSGNTASCRDRVYTAARRRRHVCCGPGSDTRHQRGRIPSLPRTNRQDSNNFVPGVS